MIAMTANGADVDAGLARLDELAGDVLEFPDARTPAGLARVLFVEWGFAGNTGDYGDPRNSLLPDVLDRRLGLPITLSVLLIEVGRRIGVTLHGVGMPGHFLVGVDDDPDQFVDPFHAGVVLDAGGCAERFAALYGPRVPFDARLLRPTNTRLILLRMLTNLQLTYVARRSPDAQWVANLRLAFPELTGEERRQAAEVLASVGAYGDAAAVVDALAADAPESARAELGQQATAYRARSN